MIEYVFILHMPDIALDIKNIDTDGSFSDAKLPIRVIITAAEITAGSFFKTEVRMLINITNVAAERICIEIQTIIQVRTLPFILHSPNPETL